MNILVDGTGKSYAGKIDANNQFHVFTESETVIQDATNKGFSFNINTGTIGLTSATESAVLYFKNNESPVNGESSIAIDAIAIGIDDEGTTAGMSTITVIRNPTTGTIIDNATAVDMNQNRNFGSSQTLADSIAYKGAEGYTFTNGDDIIQFYQQPGSRGYYTLDAVLTRGSSIGIKIDTDTSSGTSNVYAALILRRIDGNNK